MPVSTSGTASATCTPGSARTTSPRSALSIPTQNGMLYPLQQAAPQANLVEANRMAFCKYMKMITLPKLRDSLRDMKFEVKVSADLAERARVPIERMVAIG